MHILFLTDNFPPEVNAPASRTHEHAREWVRAGHEVTVVTCAPNFPTGRLFDGYRNRLRQSETVDGIRVVRVWTYITANEGFLTRSLDYASFMASAILAAPFERRPDVVVATSPHFFTAIAGYMVSRMRRRPFVFELRDLWPESIRAVGAMSDGRLFRTLERIELFLYRRADAVVSVTHAFRHDLARRGIDPRKVHVVTNGADLSRYMPRPRDEALAASLGLEGKTVAGYFGTHGLAHALDTLLRAGRRLEAEGRDDIRILLLGAGAQKAALEEEAERMGLRSVIFLDTVPKCEIPRYWSLLDLSIIHLKKSELFTTVIPSKMFECMAMGVPILHGVRGESAAIVERSGAGITFEPEDDAELADRLKALADDPAWRRHLAERGPEAARGYDRSALANELLKVLKTVTGTTT